MSRSVILASILALFVSHVLAQTAPLPEKTENGTECLTDPKVMESVSIIKRCFKNIVQLHLNSSAVLDPGDCRNSADFGAKLDSYYSTLTEICKRAISFNTTNIVKLIDYSLRNNSFKTFYEDIACVRKYETNISNTCVRNKVGFFNITKEHTHYSWTSKINVQFSKNNCNTSKGVKNCTADMLQPCRNTTSKYITNLIEYAWNLGNCSQFPDTATVPPANGTGTPSVAAHWFTTPVIITLSIGAVVLLAAIITIIVIKCNK